MCLSWLVVRRARRAQRNAYILGWIGRDRRVDGRDGRDGEAHGAGRSDGRGTRTASAGLEPGRAHPRPGWGPLARRSDTAQRAPRPPKHHDLLDDVFSCPGPISVLPAVPSARSIHRPQPALPSSYRRLAQGPPSPVRCQTQTRRYEPAAGLWRDCHPSIQHAFASLRPSGPSDIDAPVWARSDETSSATRNAARSGPRPSQNQILSALPT